MRDLLLFRWYLPLSVPPFTEIKSDNFMFIDNLNKGVNYDRMYHCGDRRIYWSGLQISDRSDPTKRRMCISNKNLFVYAFLDRNFRTFIINAAGCFLIGMIAALAVKTNWLNPKAVLFLKVGICGGFTTFSSFALETGGLIEDGRMNIAVLYAVLSVAAGVIAVFAGQGIIKKI